MACGARSRTSWATLSMTRRRHPPVQEASARRAPSASVGVVGEHREDLVDHRLVVAQPAGALAGRLVVGDLAVEEAFEKLVAQLGRDLGGEALAHEGEGVDAGGVLGGEEVGFGGHSVGAVRRFGFEDGEIGQGSVAGDHRREDAAGANAPGRQRRQAHRAALTGHGLEDAADVGLGRLPAQGRRVAVAALEGDGTHHAVEEDDRAVEELGEGDGNRFRVGALEHEGAEAVVDGNDEAKGGVFALEELGGRACCGVRPLPCPLPACGEVVPGVGEADDFGGEGVPGGGRLSFGGRDLSSPLSAASAEGCSGAASVVVRRVAMTSPRA